MRENDAASERNAGPLSLPGVTMMNRAIGLMLAFGSVCALASLAPGWAQSPPPNVYRSLESGGPVHDAGEIRGRIESVDYPAGTILVRSGRTRRTIAVVPSTTIYQHGLYATLADLRRGERADLWVYEVGGRLVAQTIRI
jgi:hypothetical protein